MAERVVRALEAWDRDDTIERLARWRSDPDARSASAVAESHDTLRSARMRDAYLEALERGAWEGAERATMAAWLRDAHLAPARARAREALRAALVATIPHDSNHHRGAALLLRIGTTANRRHRHAMASSVEASFREATRALRDGRGWLEEGLEAAAWLADEPKPPDAGDDVREAATEALEATDAAWAELSERLGHAAKSPTVHWADLFFVLRAQRWDDLVPAATRWRRLAERLRPLGLGEELAKRARAEAGSDRLRGAMVVRERGRDVRVGPGVELGVASERHGMLNLGRAAASLLAHPGLPPALARTTPGTVGRALGALLAHLAADPVFVERAMGRELSPGQRRGAAELALGLELFELRTAAASALSEPHASEERHRDVAREHLRRAWGVEVLPPDLAAIATADLHGDAHARLRSSRWAPSLFVTLRDTFDEDFWRDPRAMEPLRHAFARGASLSVEAWMEELGASFDALGPRVTELLG